jgi:glycosyltransferase involved in cell wall biosynthesis
VTIARESLLGKSGGRPDLVYGSGAGRLAYATCGLARLLGIPYVFELTNNNIDAFIHNRATGFVARGAGKIFALSKPLRGQFIRLGVPADRIWLRPNPVETDRFRVPTPLERAEMRKALAIAESNIMHLMVGALADRKNQMLALDAIERLPEKHHLMIVGPAMPNEPQYAATLKTRIMTSPALGRIRLVSEFISDVTPLMRAADCLWLPSKEEGLPNVMLEALCSGVPCIINRELGLEQHVFDLINGLRAAPQAGAWVDAVQAVGSLLADHERRRSISEQARRLYDSANTDGQLWRHLCEVACGGI